MRKKLLLLDLLMLLLAVALGEHLRQKWLEARRREEVELGLKVQPLPTPPFAAAVVPAPLAAAGYTEVVQKMLFAADRNPNVILEPPAPPPPDPPLPGYFGIYNLGNGPVALMSVEPGKPAKEVRFGEKVGEWTLVKVTQDMIVLGLRDKQVIRKLEELRAKASSQAPVQQASAPPPPANNQAMVQQLGPSVAPGTMAKEEFTAGRRNCVPGDNAPNGAEKDGYRKVSRKTPFGESCFWEAIR